ncbi:hypothetical protein FHS27_005919 [Rhodopirellula rubra]|uniref:Uncharacterized protein n=1 Tax=Aporhodopirellula rubra TaxID=980271 RepID=A0A7W5E5U0_9BACT|nr:hypothetical protein [Aporhodopirellula rubra]
MYCRQLQVLQLPLNTSRTASVIGSSMGGRNGRGSRGGQSETAFDSSPIGSRQWSHRGRDLPIELMRALSPFWPQMAALGESVC